MSNTLVGELRLVELLATTSSLRTLIYMLSKAGPNGVLTTPVGLILTRDERWDHRHGARNECFRTRLVSTSSRAWIRV